MARIVIVEHEQERHDQLPARRRGRGHDVVIASDGHHGRCAAPAVHSHRIVTGISPFHELELVENLSNAGRGLGFGGLVAIYALKSITGIDLFQDAHLADLL